MDTETTITAIIVMILIFVGTFVAVFYVNKSQKQDFKIRESFKKDKRYLTTYIPYVSYHNKRLQNRIRKYNVLIEKTNREIDYFKNHNINSFIDIEYCYYDTNGVTNNKVYKYNVLIDENNQKIYMRYCVNRYYFDDLNCEIYEGYCDKDFYIIDFDKIIGLDVTINKQKVGEISRAIVGDILFGTAGAIIGALTAKEQIKSLKLVLKINDFNLPTFTFDLCYGKVNEGINFANQLVSAISIITKQNINNNGIIRGTNNFKKRTLNEYINNLDKYTKEKEAAIKRLLEEERQYEKKQALSNHRPIV